MPDDDEIVHSHQRTPEKPSINSAIARREWASTSDLDNYGDYGGVIMEGKAGGVSNVTWPDLELGHSRGPAVRAELCCMEWLHKIKPDAIGVGMLSF